MLGCGRWDDDALLCDYVIENLEDADAILTDNETGLLRQGKASCRVGR